MLKVFSMSHSPSSNFKTHTSVVFFDSELFKTVQMKGLFNDSKTFADAIPKKSYSEILSMYDIERADDENFDLTKFIHKYFDIPTISVQPVTRKTAKLNDYIEALWDGLSRPKDNEAEGTLLPLKKPYIVPGGRFREIYYWDSYFTALGLVRSNRIALAESMRENFIDLQSRYGRIPNGNRSYYLSRSQPPILGLMVELLLPFQNDKKSFLKRNLEGMIAEYSFWMSGQDSLNDTELEHRRVVKFKDGSFLNRYWDDNSSARPESYKEDIELFEGLNSTDQECFYRNIRAACESGWDFSSRWLGKDNSLASIRTTRIIPIDLNCLLFKQESLLSEYFLILDEPSNSLSYAKAAASRQKAINKYMWSEEDDFYMDYDLDTQQPTPTKSLAGAVPLFVGLANSQQGQSVGIMIEKEFLKEGGLITTTSITPEQWDAPNGWAPLHWFVISGLRNYGLEPLAEVIRLRWLQTNDVYFESSGKAMEKYNVCKQTFKASGGEYDVQEGFGWTNGVYQALLE
jgi:alpha,alpha-trehalase